MKELERKRGDTYANELTLSRRSNGQLLDITGYTFKLTLNREKNPKDTTKQVYQIAGTILDATNGVVEFAPTAEQADQDPGVYWYDVEMIDASGRKRTILEGKYTFTQDITK